TLTGRTWSSGPSASTVSMVPASVTRSSCCCRRESRKRLAGKAGRYNSLTGPGAAGIIALVFLLLVFFTAPREAATVMRVVRWARRGASLLRNGGFEAACGGLVVGWQPWQNGF